MLDNLWSHIDSVGKYAMPRTPEQLYDREIVINRPQRLVINDGNDENVKSESPLQPYIFVTVRSIKHSFEDDKTNRLG